MGTGKGEPQNGNQEKDNHPEGTKLGHYILGKFKSEEGLSRVGKVIWQGKRDSPMRLHRYDCFKLEFNLTIYRQGAWKRNIRQS